MSTIPWPTALALLLVGCAVSYALGAMRVNTFYHHWLREHDDNLRLLYLSTGFEYPRTSDKGHDPGWWQRRDQPMSSRITVPPTMPEPETEGEVEVEIKVERVVEPKTAEIPVVKPKPAPQTETRPDMKKAAAVQPPARLTDDEWEAKQEADMEPWRREQAVKWGES